MSNLLELLEVQKKRGKNKQINNRRGRYRLTILWIQSEINIQDNQQEIFEILK
jgi:hypothetical protein